MTTERHEEFVPFGPVLHSLDAQTYQCPFCLKPVITQYEGTDTATRIDCKGPLEGHLVVWERTQ